MGLYKQRFKISLGADKTWDCSLWWLGRALQSLLQSQLCLAQEVDCFSSSKTEKTGLGNSSPGYVLLQFILSHADCFCLAVPAPSCRQIGFGTFFAAFTQASVWVRLLLSACLCTAMPIPGTDSLGCGVGAGEDGAWLYKNGVDVPYFRSSCVALAQDYLVYLVGNTLWLSGASCTLHFRVGWIAGCSSAVALESLA